MKRGVNIWGVGLMCVLNVSHIKINVKRKRFVVQILSVLFVWLFRELS